MERHLFFRNQVGEHGFNRSLSATLTVYERTPSTILMFPDLSIADVACLLFTA